MTTDESKAKCVYDSLNATNVASEKEAILLAEYDRAKSVYEIDFTELCCIKGMVTKSVQRHINKVKDSGMDEGGKLAGIQDIIMQGHVLVTKTTQKVLMTMYVYDDKSAVVVIRVHCEPIQKEASKLPPTHVVAVISIFEGVRKLRSLKHLWKHMDKIGANTEAVKEFMRIVDCSDYDTAKLLLSLSLKYMLIEPFMKEPLEAFIKIACDDKTTHAIHNFTKIAVMIQDSAQSVGT